MKQIPNSNEEFAERFRKLNQDTRTEQEQLYGGDWSDISINSIISDIVNSSVSYLREGLDGIETAIEKYGKPKDDPATIEINQEIKCMHDYLDNF